MNWYTLKKAMPIADKPSYVQTYFDVGHKNWPILWKNPSRDQYDQRLDSKNYIWDIRSNPMQQWSLRIMEDENRETHGDMGYSADERIARGRYEIGGKNPDGLASMIVYKPREDPAYNMHLKRIEKFLDDQLHQRFNAYPHIVLMG